MNITKEILAAIETGTAKIKGIEAQVVTPENSEWHELRENSFWLEAVNDIINRTGLAIRDAIEQDVKQPTVYACESCSIVKPGVIWREQTEQYECGECYAVWREEEGLDNL